MALAINLKSGFSIHTKCFRNLFKFADTTVSLQNILASNVKQLSYHWRNKHYVLHSGIVNHSQLFQARKCSTEENDSTKEGEDMGVETKGKKPYMQVDALTSIQYMESDAYRETYGELPVWHHYRPNHPGGRPRKITRRSCVVGGFVSTGSPCPICRDQYLKFDYRNMKLLKQFLNPSEMAIYRPARTQICMKQNKQLLIALEKAKDVGYLEDKNLQFRSYDYSEYYKSLGRAKKDPKPNHRSNSVVHRILNLDSQV